MADELDNIDREKDSFQKGKATPSGAWTQHDNEDDL